MDYMELAGNIIKSMGKFLNIEDLSTTGDFPDEFQILVNVFSQVENFIFYKLNKNLSISKISCFCSYQHNENQYDYLLRNHRDIYVLFIH